MGMGRRTGVGAAVAECVGGVGRQNHGLRRAAGRWSEKRPRERVESGCGGRAASGEERGAERARSGPGAPAGGAPSDPRGAGAAAGTLGRRERAAQPPLSFWTPPGPWVPNPPRRPLPVRRGASRDTRDEGDWVPGGGGETPPHPPLFSQKCWVTSSGVARRADTVQDGKSLNQDRRGQAWVCPNASASSVRGLGGAQTRCNPEPSRALLLLEVSALGARAALGEVRPPSALPRAGNNSQLFCLWTRERRGGG